MISYTKKTYGYIMIAQVVLLIILLLSWAFQSANVYKNPDNIDNKEQIKQNLDNNTKYFWLIIWILLLNSFLYKRANK